jgi:hypothetical protein
VAIGALNRKQFRAAIYTLVDAATGATRLDDRISLEQAVRGRQSAYYAVETFDDEDPQGHRGKGLVPKSYAMTIRLAFHLLRYTHDTDAGRDAADDAIDDLERSLYQPAAGQAASVANLDVTRIRKVERLHESREWLIYDLTVDALAMLDLSA